VFAYLKGTKNLGILYNVNENEKDLVGYSDDYYASDLEMRRSTTRYFFCMNGGPVTWSS